MRKRRGTSTPARSSSPISSNNAFGDNTTPLPMKQVTLSWRMPEGINRRMVFLPLMTSVWPALWPPWKRTTPATRSVSRSTILPLPSSPHCAPITTTLRFIAPRSLMDSPADQIQQQHAADHARQAPQPQLPVGESRHHRQHAFHRLGIEKRQNAFQHQIQRECRQQIRPPHASSAQRRSGRFRYLKNSLSEPITSTSLSVPIDLSYACRLR